MKKTFLSILFLSPLLVFGQKVETDLPFSDLPPVNEYGKCFAKCKIPDVYESVDVQVVARQASSRTVKHPARYENQTERIMVKEGGVSYKTIPATYKSVSEQILVEPAKTVKRTIPAKYRTASRQILVQEEHGEWVKKKKAPNCLSQNPDDCYIVCWEMVPAKYRTETYSEMVEPSREEEDVIPAKYTTITKRVLDQPAKTVEIPIEPEYRTVSHRVMIEPETVTTVDEPAVYRTVKEKRLVKQGGFTVWTEILCESKTTNDRVSNIQKALKDKGFDPGEIDGKMGLKTQTALKQFQTENNLPTGNVNIQTLKALGVAVD